MAALQKFGLFVRQVGKPTAEPQPVVLHFIVPLEPLTVWEASTSKVPAPFVPPTLFSLGPP